MIFKNGSYKTSFFSAAHIKFLRFIKNASYVRTYIITFLVDKGKRLKTSCQLGKSRTPVFSFLSLHIPL